MFSFIKNIGPTELIIIGVILTLFFGSKVVIWLAKTSGESLKEIKKVRKTFVEAVEDDNKSS
jgi:Sec-independent protein translocase protein TatA